MALGHPASDANSQGVPGVALVQVALLPSIPPPTCPTLLVRTPVGLHPPKQGRGVAMQRLQGWVHPQAAALLSVVGKDPHKVIPGCPGDTPITSCSLCWEPSLRKRARTKGPCAL